MTLAALTTPEDIAKLMRAIITYDKNPLTKAALLVSAYLFARPGEIRQMKWEEVNLEDAEWSLPKEKVKAGGCHITPLATQVVSLLQKVREMEIDSPYVFPGVRDHQQPMGSNTVNSAIRDLGFEKHEMCAYGFRQMAATRLIDMGYDDNLVGLQMAYVSSNSTVEVIDHNKQFLERVEMMQAWADYLDKLNRA